MKFHDDPYLLNTILKIVTNAHVSVIEAIYRELEGTTWTIEKIERTAEKLIKIREIEKQYL